MPLHERLTLRELRRKAREGEKITMLALYDYALAHLAQEAAIDGIIVGDSVAQQVYGHTNTLKATMDMMVRHTQAVRRGGPNLFVIADMPYMSYQPSVEAAVRNAGRFMAEGEADAVKFEGGTNVVEKLAAVIAAGIPVVGHLGFTPQSAAMAGGTIVQAREADFAVRLVREAVELDRAGVSLLILECVPPAVTDEVVKRLSIPVIGIGSGPSCHGVVLLAWDILGLTPGRSPGFVKKYADLAGPVADAFRRYAAEVRGGDYPAVQQCYGMKDQERDAFLRQLQD